MLGCAMPEAEQGLNVARIASLRAGIPVSASAVTMNRFCSSGLQAIAFAAERIMAGCATAIVAGGTESMSLVPMGGHKPSPNPSLVESLSRHLPDDRAGRRESRPRLRDRPRGTGRVRAAQPSARRGRNRCRTVRRRDRQRNGSDVDPACRRRRAAPRHVARSAGQAQARVSRHRHRHRRQLVADERRRGGGRRDGAVPRQRARLDAARPVRRLRDRRGRARALRHRAGAGHPAGR